MAENMTVQHWRFSPCSSNQPGPPGGPGEGGGRGWFRVELGWEGTGEQGACQIFAYSLEACTGQNSSGRPEDIVVAVGLCRPERLLTMSNSCDHDNSQTTKARRFPRNFCWPPGAACLEGPLRLRIAAMAPPGISSCQILASAGSRRFLVSSWLFLFWLLLAPPGFS